jgi:hypothetical protein
LGSQDPDLVPTLEKHAEKPDRWKHPVEDTLKEVGADQDQELVDRATELLKTAEATQPGNTGGLVGQINAQGGKVLVMRVNSGSITF